MRVSWKQWTRWTVIGVLVAYGGVRGQSAFYDWKIRRAEGTLEQLRPAVLDVVRTKELEATVLAQREFARAVNTQAIDWEHVFLRLSTAIPPSMVLHTVTVEGSRVTLNGILRHPPPEPEAYVAAVANVLKADGVFQEVTVTVAPPAPDDPSVIGVDLVGVLQ